MTDPLILSLSNIPPHEIMVVGGKKHKGVRVQKGQKLILDGNEITGLDNAFITCDDKKRALIVLDSLIRSITVGDVVKLKKYVYVVEGIVPANQEVPKNLQGRNVAPHPMKKQTYIVASDKDRLRVTASEITNIIRKEA
jgi:hypothetical protein